MEDNLLYSNTKNSTNLNEYAKFLNIPTYDIESTKNHVFIYTYLSHKKLFHDNGLKH